MREAQHDKRAVRLDDAVKRKALSARADHFRFRRRVQHKRQALREGQHALKAQGARHTVLVLLAKERGRVYLARGATKLQANAQHSKIRSGGHCWIWRDPADAFNPKVWSHACTWHMNVTTRTFFPSDHYNQRSILSIFKPRTRQLQAVEVPERRGRARLLCPRSAVVRQPLLERVFSHFHPERT